MSFDDVASGDRQKCGAYVDGGVYDAFREWVEEQRGEQYAEVGRALDRAMLEYMDKDRAERIETKLNEVQKDVDAVADETKLNQALLRKVIDRLENDTVENKSPNLDREPPKGKSPGDRKKREMLVIEAIYRSGSEEIHLETVKEYVREVAGVSSSQTVKDYAQQITGTRAFMKSRTPNKWRVDRDAAADLLQEHNIKVDA